MTARAGKPNTTGRSSGKIGGRLGRLMRPPDGEPFIWLTQELLESDAWQSLGINARRFVDFLLLDHMGHAGRENGRLKATYDQLVAFGITRRLIGAAIGQAEKAGLVDSSKGGMRVPTTYALTFYALPDGTPASNKWMRYKARLRRSNKAPHREPEKQKSAPTSGTSKAPHREPDSPNLPPHREPDQSPTSGTPSISRRGSSTSPAEHRGAQPSTSAAARCSADAPPSPSPPLGPADGGPRDQHDPDCF